MSKKKKADLLKVTGLNHSLIIIEKHLGFCKCRVAAIKFSLNTHTHSHTSHLLHYTVDLAANCHVHQTWIDGGWLSQLCLPLEMIMLIGIHSGAVNPQHLLAFAP